MKYRGNITSGLGEASYWVKKIEDIFFDKVNKKLFYGTLNIRLTEDLILYNEDFVILKEEFNGTEDLFFKKCKLLGEVAYIIRTRSNNTKDIGHHPLNIIEIIAETNFREKYNLKNEDEIIIEIGENINE